MLDNALALMDEYAMLPAGGTVLCAVSGGADSVCLLHLLHSLAETRGFTLHAAHFDHQLRGEFSTADAVFVENLCKEWKLPFHLGRGNVAAAAAERGGIEEIARTMRYAFLEETAQEIGADLIATAHNAGDNVETVFLHLLRGTGLQGLTGIPPRRGALVRPLLTTPRTDIEAYLRAHHLTWREDASNADDTYTRNYIRHQLIPQMEARNPRFLAGMERTIRLLRQDNDFLNAQAAQVAALGRWAEDDLVIEARHIASAPAAIAPRAVRTLLAMLGNGSTDYAAAHLEAVVELARGSDPSAMVDLPGGLMAQRVYGELLLTTRRDPVSFSPTPLVLDGKTRPKGALWGCRCRRSVCPDTAPPDTCYLAPFQGTPLLRPRETGDEIKLPGRDTKRLKKLFIDEKIPRRDRERIPVLVDEGGVLALPHFGPNAPRLAQPREPAWEVTFFPQTTTESDAPSAALH
ncbi:MAG TPA: tRNA lysidine(34) synthetase TilS [Candidatus Flavonifractor merdigallinarum]|uniref:tRNA(Ile)-lysidine synthase n=1 Tax=Candidatus Flavonifractor merdigallinarum TaxID=2838589 RepID=A0A9D1Y872_9FIRM|nr:tRNA lysidine(34) synthetase TilS [Candidatus Flavonifractor merdigallinarum]